MKAVELSEVTKKFKDKVAVDNVSLKVVKGDVFGLIGPNGAGKTTTAMMITTVLTPTNGDISVFGEDVAKRGVEAKRKVGVVFQECLLDDELSVKDNLEVHGYIYGLSGEKGNQRASEALRLVGLEKESKTLTRNLSGGMKKRLEIARSMLHNPDLIILDEPTLGLDPLMKKNIWEHVKMLSRKGKTVLLTTNNMSEAEELCNRVAFINNGKVIAEGSASDLKKKVKAKSLEEAFLRLAK